ncbi:MFS transporter, partial [Saccharomonospora sp.]|uniref:MFS transporter n=1 Tax=Saccharomonospora sp. TaxID=33913 RepID=UPI0026260C59
EIVGQTFLGGPVGSLTFALFAAFPFLLDSVAFALGAALLAAMSGNYHPRRDESGQAAPATTAVRTDIAEGLRWLRHNPLLLRLVVVAGLVSLVSELAQAQLVLYALQDLDLSNAAYGAFAFAGGIGGLGGAAVASRLIDRFGGRPTLVTGAVGCGVTFLAMGFVSQPVVSAVLFGLFAAAIVVVNVILATARHMLVPEELLGRVLGVWRTVVWGALPVGALLGGLATRVLGTPSATFALSGVLLLGVAGVAWLAVRNHEVTPTHHS